MLASEPTIHLKSQRHELSELMAIYECNYIRLRQMIADVATLPAGRVYLSRARGALDLYLQVSETSRYTTTLSLTYQFEDAMGRFPAPDIHIRTYHDARLSEVMSCGRLRGRRDAVYDRTRNHYSLDQKWYMNRFLQKWLGYCLRQGHRFSGTDNCQISDQSWDQLIASLKS